jgi:hypothetical protein
VSRHLEGAAANGKAFPLFLVDARGDRSGASVEASIPEEGATREKDGFPRAGEVAG